MKNVIVAMAAGMMALGGFADEAKPLLGGFHPDPSICRGADGAYYLVTSSFMWNPGLPIYRRTNFRDWKLIGHALPDFSALPTGSIAMRMAGCRLRSPEETR